MAKFIIRETKEIIKGFQTTTYHVEATTKEEAEELVRNSYDDDSKVEELETEYDVRDAEHLYFD